MLESLSKSPAVGHLLRVSLDLTAEEVQKQLDELNAAVKNGQMAIERKKQLNAAIQQPCG
jgi:hypothetical protein